MKHIYVNLKRFDVPAELGGVNRVADIQDWGAYMIDKTKDTVAKYASDDAEFVMFLPELHILNASKARAKDSKLQIGCQSLFREDVKPGGNFGAFTSLRPAAAFKAAGCSATLIGHCEERNNIKGILDAAGVADKSSVNKILNGEVKRALERDIRVLYCIGETAEEQDRWEEVLGAQLHDGLDGVDTSKVVIAYEPVWSIGPGKTPAGKEYIQKIARFIKKEIPGIDVVYGGGLKSDNAQMLASIDEIDGGLIALTRFQGEIGFYPDEYEEIVRLYLGK